MVRCRGRQIRRANLRVYSALDETSLTVQDLAGIIGMRRETLSRKLNRYLSDAEQDALIRAIRTAGEQSTGTTGTTTSGRKRNVAST